VGPRASMDGRKISSPPVFDPGTSSPWLVVIPTELPGPHIVQILHIFLITLIDLLFYYQKGRVTGRFVRVGFRRTD